MIKKLIIMGILTIPFLLLTKMATAQNYEIVPPYEEMPAKVQAQMDYNKSISKPLLTDVIATFEIVVNGLEESEYAELKSRANELTQIKSIKIENNGKVTIVIDGASPFVTIKKIFSNLVIGLTSINGTYSVKNSK